MLYFVSRQAYWPAGELVVEIAAGGCEYSNPDMLSDPEVIYGPLGDMLETSDPRKALAAAFRIKEAWEHQLYLYAGDEAESVRIEAGFTYGCTMPFEEHPTDAQLREWAEAEWEATPKCPCGEPLPERGRITLCFPYEDEGPFCSEYCAEKTYDELESYYEEEDSDN